MSCCRLTALLCAAALAVSCSKRDEAGPAPGPPVVEVTPVVQQDVPLIREWVGTLDGSNNVNVQAHVTGYLMAQQYREGALIQKGELLFQLDERPFVAELELAKANLAKSQANQVKTGADAKRFTTLYEEKAVSQEERDTAVQANAAALADVAAQKAAVTQAQLNQQFTKITAPVQGIVGTATANIGDLVTAGATTLTTISTVDPMKVYFSLSEQEYLREAPRLRQMETIPEAQRETVLELILADGSTYPHKGRFDFTDRQVDARTGTVRITGLFPNPERLLKPGQFARVRVALEVLKGALLVPQRAVSELQGMHQAVVVGPNGKAQIRTVQTGERVGPLWIIREGLRPGERVVVEGLQKARDGQPVTARPWKAK